MLSLRLALSGSDSHLQKRLKRKEYPKPSDFANDVELVFSNALEFNQERTQIWEDAVTLRVGYVTCYFSARAV